MLEQLSIPPNLIICLFFSFMFLFVLLGMRLIWGWRCVVCGEIWGGGASVSSLADTTCQFLATVFFLQFSRRLHLSISCHSYFLFLFGQFSRRHYLSITKKRSHLADTTCQFLATDLHLMLTQLDTLTFKQQQAPTLQKLPAQPLWAHCMQCFLVMSGRKNNSDSRGTRELMNKLMNKQVRGIAS